MIFEKTLKAAIAVAAAGAATAVAVGAASFALYALLEPMVGRPGAATLVALVFALLAAIVALVMSAAVRGRKSHKDDPADQSLPERLLGLARERPILSAGAAIAAGVIIMRNPALVGLVTAALLKKPDHRRR